MSDARPNGRAGALRLKCEGAIPASPNMFLPDRAIRSVPAPSICYKNGADTLYRIHGTNDPSTIGGNVSAGCFRMTNTDVLDLYERMEIGARVIVR